MSQPSLPFSPRAVAFAGYLRRLGFGVSPAQTLDFIHSLAWIDLADRASVCDAGRAVFVRHQNQAAVFDAAFDRFWSHAVLDPRAKRSTVEDLRHAPVWSVSAIEPSDLADPLVPAANRANAYNRAERLQQRDFGTLDAGETAAVMTAVETLAGQLPLRHSRRLRPGRRGRQLDLRTTLRASVRTGGDPVQLARRSRQVKPRPILLLCDVSGSMERYARILLQFAYALVNTPAARPRKVEAYVFATALTRVTPYLRPLPGAAQRRAREFSHLNQSGAHPGEQALAAAVAAARDWGGGTRIGECLRTLHSRWPPSLLGSGAVVLLISDGCDRGDIPLLQSQLARLQRRAYRLIWLNPWLGQAGYQPAVRGMQAALPHVDQFLPIHNLAALAQLVAALAKLDA
jgi:uncharacterized protein with von Willebrand factor type A (vWA) domain